MAFAPSLPPKEVWYLSLPLSLQFFSFLSHSLSPSSSLTNPLSPPPATTLPHDPCMVLISITFAPAQTSPRPDQNYRSWSFHCSSQQEGETITKKESVGKHWTASCSLSDKLGFRVFQDVSLSRLATTLGPLPDTTYALAFPT